MRIAGLASAVPALVLAWCGLAPAAVVQADQPGVIKVDAEPAVEPGPPILHAPPAQVPQLENTGIWHAPPILVSGTSAYRDGEFLYQDFLYDDHGARALPDPNDRRTNLTPKAGTPFNSSFSLPSGTFSYPSAPAYAENAADLVELRIRPLQDSTALRVTLNTMNDPSLVALSVAIGGTAGTLRPFPHGANVSAPADYFLTVHPSPTGMTADIVRAADGTAISGPAPRVTVDATRRQIEVRVPRSSWSPSGVVRMAAGVGLWDRVNSRYLLPQSASSATVPGGAGAAANPAAFFNVAFRYHEPIPTVGAAGAAQDFGNPAWWRDQAQGAALAKGDISDLFAEVDFDKLRARIDDESGVPTSGPMSRILPSHFEPRQGIDYGASCYSGDFNCQYQGRLQPYIVYVPHKPRPQAGYGLTLLLHANATNYNEYFGTRHQSELGERGPGSIVVTPQARDPAAGDYSGYGAVDVFEVWADVSHRFRLDPSWTAITGYSMGGFGTYKLGEAFPDLFGRALSVVGSPGGIVPSTPVPYTGETTELASLRNLPMGIWDVTADELNPNASLNAAALTRMGYRYDSLTFPGDHFTLLYNDEYSQAAAYLGTSRVEPNPEHVTYVYTVHALDGLARPFGDFPTIGLVSGHAYWISGMQLGSAGEGTVDAVSHGLGVADAKASGMQTTAGALGPGALFPALPYVENYQTWGPPPSAPREDRLDLTTQNVSAVTIDVVRAGVDCDVSLNVSSDIPVRVTLAGCSVARRFAVDASSGGRASRLPDTAADDAGAAPLLCLLLTGLAAGWSRSRRWKANSQPMT